MAGKKRPKFRHAPQAQKLPHAAVTPSSQAQKPSWRFSRLDHEGAFCWKSIAGDEINDILGKLINFESMTWQEIEGHQHHYIAEGGMTPEAVRRLADLQLDEFVEDIFSLRITSAKRIIGIREAAILHLIWWDSEHRVAKSKTYRQ